MLSVDSVTCFDQINNDKRNFNGKVNMCIKNLMYTGRYKRETDRPYFKTYIQYTYNKRNVSYT